MYKSLYSLVLTSIMVAAPALAADDTAPGATQPDHFRMSKRIAEGGPGAREKFGLSDDQLEKMSSLNNKFKDSIGAQKTQLGSLHRQLKDVFAQPQLDRAKAVDLQTKINALKAEISIAKLNFKMDKLSILTPEQREKIRHRLLVSQAMGGKMQGPGGHCSGGGHSRGRMGGHHFRGHSGPGAPGMHRPGGSGKFGFNNPGAPGSVNGPAVAAPGDDDEKPLVQS